MSECGSCGKKNSASYKFCRGCGKPPGSGGSGGQTCELCGKLNTASAKACKECGAPFDMKAPVKKASEKKSVTERTASRSKVRKEEDEEEEEAAKKPRPKVKDEATDAPKKAGRKAKARACENCSFRNEEGYAKCVQCGAANPEKAAEEAAAKKKAQQPIKKEKSKPKIDEEEKKKAELLKGMDFKTKKKGATEVSTIKLGDLSPGMKVWAAIGGEDGWIQAEVIEAKKDKVKVSHEDDGSENEYPMSKIFIRNPPNMDNVADLTQLSYMHEPGLLYILSERYTSKQIYTFTGSTLIAVNPYARLPLYTKDILDSYVGQPIGRMPPHIFAIAEDAFRSMIDFTEPQSVLVSGESGAGKTETTKVLLQYLAAMGHLSEGGAGGAGGAVEKKGKKGKAAAGGGGGGSASSVEKQVLQSNPVLEAFGNAKTLRNDNSSRFGKFIRIQFNARGQIEGAKVQTYLLEKPRLTYQMAGERNFHIFYQLCKGASKIERKQLALKEVKDYFYLNQGECFDVPSIDDAEEFETLRDALKIFGIGAEEQKALWRYLSGILELGNITFKQEDDGREDAVLDQGKPLAYAAKLLGLKQEDIKKTLLRRQVVVGKNTITIRLKPSEAETARDAFAMLLYGRLFDHLVSIINKGLAGTGIDEESKRFIGVLDIYGFEFFEKNSFEQFCINWANEKLQQQFNQHIFKLEQAEYVREKIDWAYIEFADNQPILALIEDKNPMGIIPILDEQCRFPKSDHFTFAEKMALDFKDNQYFEKPKFSKTAFTIDHYAGKVTYDTTLFLDKNRDYLIPEHFIILGDSEEALVKEMFEKPAAEFKASGGSMKFASVGSAFKTSLADLMSVINRTSTHYIRCIKPNDKKKPGVFQKSMSLHQLRCGGVLETVRIASAGFPTRWLYQKFCDRYRILAPLLYDEHQNNWKECAAALIQKIGLEPSQFQMGITKVFLRAGLVALFEELLKRKLDEAAIMIQKHFLGWVKRKQFLRIKRDVVVVQCRARRYLAKGLLKDNRERLFAIMIQSHARSFTVCRSYKKLLKSARLVQRKIFKKILLKKLKTLLDESRAKKKKDAEQQKMMQQKEEKKLKIIVRLQSVIRMKSERRKFLVMRAQARDVVGKLSKVMDEKSQLETKAEELNWRLTAEHRAKAKLQEQVSEMDEKLKREVEERQKVLEEQETQKKTVKELEKSVAEEKKKNEELSQLLQKRENELKKKDEEMEEIKVEIKQQLKSRDDMIEELKVEIEESKTNAVNEGRISEQAKIIAELEKEVKRVQRLLDEEKMRAKEITESVMSLKAQEVDQLQSKIQEAFGFVPAESYFGLLEETNSPMLLSTRQQMESLALMTSKKSKDESVYALLDFVFTIREGFSNVDSPSLGLSIIHVLNHWDCFRKERDDLFNHVIQGVIVEIPEIALVNNQLSYYLTSMLYVLHGCNNQLLVAGVDDPWYMEELPMDEAPELPELQDDQLLPSCIHFLNKLRNIISTMYMELVFNTYEELDAILRPTISGTLSGNHKSARSSFQNVLKELEKIVDIGTSSFWPSSVLKAFFRQILFYVNAFYVNNVLNQKNLCTRAAGTAMSVWFEDFKEWAKGQKLVLIEECKDELKMFKQVLDFLTADKALLPKKQFPDLNGAQLKQLCSSYVPADAGDAIAARVPRAITKGKEEGEMMIDKTFLLPLPVNSLYEASFQDLVSIPFPSSVGKKLAEVMASLDEVDHEYVVVQFDLDVFDIGDEMDDLELEVEDTAWEDEDFQELDEETRKRLMLAYDDLDKSKAGSIRLKSSASIPDVSKSGTGTGTRTSSVSEGSGSTSDSIREKLHARLEQKKREKEEEEARKKQEDEFAALAGDAGFQWQVGDNCEAVFLDDSKWYAAEILEGPNELGEFNVVFTDYGNTQWTDPDLLRLSPELLAMLEGKDDLDLDVGGTESNIFSDDISQMDPSMVSLIQPAEDPFK